MQSYTVIMRCFHLRQHTLYFCSSSCLLADSICSFWLSASASLARSSLCCIQNPQKHRISINILMQKHNTNHWHCTAIHLQNTWLLLIPEWLGRLMLKLLGNTSPQMKLISLDVSATSRRQPGRETHPRLTQEEWLPYCIHHETHLPAARSAEWGAGNTGVSDHPLHPLPIWVNL